MAKQEFETEFTFTVYPHVYTRVLQLILSPSSYLIGSRFIEEYFGRHKSETIWITMPYSIMMESTGIGCRTTLIKPLNELEAIGLLDIRSGFDKRIESYYRLRIGNLRIAHQMMVDNKHNYRETAIEYLQFRIDLPETLHAFSLHKKESKDTGLKIRPATSLKIRPVASNLRELLVLKQDCLKRKSTLKEKIKESTNLLDINSEVDSLMEAISNVHNKNGQSYRTNRRCCFRSRSSSIYYHISKFLERKRKVSLKEKERQICELWSFFFLCDKP